MAGVTKRKALSTMQVADKCGVHYTTVRRWILAGNLPAFETPGGHLRIMVDDVDRFLDSRRLGGGVLPTATLRVLIMDDDVVFRESCAEFLGRLPKLEVRKAANGFESGRLVAEFLPHVIILDLRMPGMDGFEVCRDIKTSPRTKHAKVLVLTGFATEENLRRAKSAGADLCVSKPVDMDRLRELVLELGRGMPLNHAPHAATSDQPEATA